MPSPFPGMDPYLEDRRVWEDFHTTFLVTLRAALKPLLPSDFVARLEERVYIVEWEHRFRADVAVVRRERPDSNSGGGVATLERTHLATPPRYLRVYEETAREVFLEIRRVREPGEVVTVIELLSPANKESGRGREEYLRKQHDLLTSDAHLIELDFLRSGEYTLAPREAALRREYGHWDYLISLHRAPAVPGFHDFAVWPLTLRDRLPEILVPLTDNLPDLALDLQAVFNRTYDEGPTETLDYTQPCNPPLSESDAEWARDQLEANGYSG
ncbi:DUF4058 family protein [Armatimonas rosea]|uniref:DUF4058 family protein n=1 Tax=Armatimonas rosea TaxID=685828 RepID=A0A7W9SKN3_ARMRO|nr:DUF4058 family protein [Armatimonas rosea]MBB6048372.1 hypothetical protein [Armatimonas rosea]